MSIWTGEFIPGVQAGAEWSWAVGPGASAASPGVRRELTTAKGRVLTRRVHGHHFAQFTMTGSVVEADPTFVGPRNPSADEAAEIVLRESDLWVWRNGIAIHRGRVVGRQIQVDADRWVANYQTVDYRGMLLLYARFKGTIPTWSNVDQHTIAWQMVQHRQAQTGGDWGIVEGIGGASGQTRTETDLTEGKPIGEAIDAIARRVNGFDWQINPDLELDRWTPRRTRDLGVVLDYGGMVTAFAGGSPEWANDVIYSGSEETTPANATADDVATDERGLWSIFGSSPNTKDQDGLDDAAEGLLADALTANSEWSLTLAPGRWEGDDQLTLGDLVTVQLAPVGFSALCRVMEMQHVPGDHGSESVIVNVREEEPEGS